MVKTYTKHNFHSHTFCIWKEVPLSEIQELRLNFKSKHDSRYYFTANGVYRFSDHWGRVANCHWRLIPLAEFKNQNSAVAFARWTDFYSNEDASKLFYIKVDTITQEVNFYHKHSLENDEKVVLRNVKDTAKTIRIIKEIITQIDWSKHLKFENLDVLRKDIIAELVNTSKSFLDIKKTYLS